MGLGVSFSGVRFYLRTMSHGRQMCGLGLRRLFPGTHDQHYPRDDEWYAEQLANRQNEAGLVFRLRSLYELEHETGREDQNEKEAKEQSFPRPFLPSRVDPQ